tara:strand:+ start:326 stop:1186 length:861 start_codon:yes stop_codon:yes gene_type:complete
MINPLDIIENLFLLFPIGLFLTLSNPNMKFKDIIKYTIFGFVLSVSVESSQLMLDSRTSQYWDVIANTTSILLGVLFALIIKPLLSNLSISSQSVARLTSALLAITCLLLIRLMMNQQNINIFELYLILTSAVLLAMLTAHYAHKGNEHALNKNIFISLTYSSLSLSPVFIAMPSLYFKLLIAHVSVSFFTFLILVKGSFKSYKFKKKIILFPITLIAVIFLSISIYNFLNGEFSVVMLPSDNIKITTEGRRYGGMILNLLLLFILTSFLTNLLFQNNKNKKINVI